MKNEVVCEFTLRLTRRQYETLRQCLNPLMKGSRLELKHVIADLDQIEAEINRAAEVFAP